jgi:membrane-bound lytic murein transglycosylase D
VLGEKTKIYMFISKRRLTPFLLLIGMSCCFVAPTQGQEEGGGSAEANAGLLDQINEDVASNDVIGYNAAEVRERLSYLSGCTKLEYDNIVSAYLQTYLFKKPHKTREMLARIPMWFHIFEAELKAQGMPDDLKYLAVTESALNPLAVSHCGATGLWQFMPATGSEYGLEQNSAVDERSDAIQATRASLTYLKRLHHMFGDWALALAAYNSGPGNVGRAIKRGHSKNFWAIRKYLPAETRNYVPAFVSATYICNFYMMHNMMPDYPDLDLQVTSHTKVFVGVAFQEICDATGLTFETVVALNPGYKKYYVPAQTQGRFIVLPIRVMDAFTRYMQSKDPDAVSSDFSHITFDSDAKDRYKAQHYNVPQGDSADRLAASFGCFRSHLVAWNHLPYGYASAGKSLLVWRPNNIKEYQKIKLSAPKPAMAGATGSSSPQVSVGKPKPTVTNTKPSTPLPATPPAKIEQKDIALPGVPSPKAIIDEEKQYVWHIMQRNESLTDVAFMYQVTVMDIQRLNGAEKFGIGARIKVKRQTVK